MRACLLLFLTLFTGFALSQDKRCASEAPTTGAFEAWISNLQAARLQVAGDAQATLYQIPVVVHVFHKGEPIGVGTNLSTERIQAQIDSLTADFRRMNADAANTPVEFQPVAADVEIEFVLARQDPNGNPTDGIVRVRGAQDVYRATFDRRQLRSESYWPPAAYFNIYVLDLQNFLGYASYPTIDLPGNLGNNSDLQFDGVLVDYAYFGVNPDAALFSSLGRTLTHEAGHYFGLRHIWGDGGCAADDFVDDTPLANTDNGGYGSPCTFPNPDDAIVCVDGEPEMFQNYMDYTNDECMNLFTEGQKTRMRTVLLNAPNRLSLTVSPGLDEPVRFSNDLLAKRVVVPGDGSCESSVDPQVEIQNVGTNAVTGYEAVLRINGIQQGNVVAQSTTLEPFQQEILTFPPISLAENDQISIEITTVNGGADGNSLNNEVTRTILQNSSISPPFFEDFENSIGVIGDFSGTDSWEVVQAPKESALNLAAHLPFYNNTTLFGDKTVFKTPVFDLNGLSSGELRFSYAYAYPADAFYDGLIVKASTDCGKTFGQTIFEGFGPNLSTASDPGAAFIPANSLEWMDTLVSITPLQNIDGVQFAFYGLNGGGNNLYIDNVEVVQTNLNENDASIISVEAPLLTCEEEASATVRIRNVGSEIIQSMSLQIQPDGQIFEVNNLSVVSKDYVNVGLPPVALSAGRNEFAVTVLTVNSVNDESPDGNTGAFRVRRDLAEDGFPFELSFAAENDWTILTEGPDSLWEESEINGNELLIANGFQSATIGRNDWFISPLLNTGNLDTAGLYFKLAYADRPGFTDRLRVLGSIDCGDSYTYTFLDATSDSLASAASELEWQPVLPTDWKEFRLDISELLNWGSEIRLAFQFISGGGNNLYIDDIAVRGNEPPSYQEVVRVFPNPASFSFNIGLNLPEKEPVTIRLLDVSGRLQFETTVPNALNQIIEMETPGKNGIYFLQVIGAKFKSSQKLFIQR